MTLVTQILFLRRFNNIVNKCGVQVRKDKDDLWGRVGERQDVGIYTFKERRLPESIFERPNNLNINSQNYFKKYRNAAKPP